MTIDQKIAIHKAMSDGNRLQILERLRAGELCACVLLDDLAITQPTLSHHMKVLLSAGLVTARKDGKWMHYSRQDQLIESLKESM